MREFIINGYLLEYKMHVQTIDNSIDGCYDCIEPTNYLCEELLKLGATHTKEHRTYYKFHCTPENLNFVFDVLKKNEFITILEDYIFASTETKINIKKVHLDFTLDTFDEFLNQFNLQISLVESPFSINEEKIKNKILKNHLELGINPDNLEFKIALCSEDRLSIPHTMYFNRKIEPEKLSYLKNIKRSIYKIDYKKNSVLFDGFITIDIKDITNG
jgi:hypothetical protein